MRAIFGVFCRSRGPRPYGWGYEYSSLVGQGSLPYEWMYGLFLSYRSRGPRPNEILGPEIKKWHLFSALTWYLRREVCRERLDLSIELKRRKPLSMHPKCDGCYTEVDRK